MPKIETLKISSKYHQVNSATMNVVVLSRMHRNFLFNTFETSAHPKTLSPLPPSEATP